MSLADEVRAMQVSRPEVERVNRNRKIEEKFDRAIESCKMSAQNGWTNGYLTIRDDEEDIAQMVISKLRSNGFRVELDTKAGQNGRRFDFNDGNVTEYLIYW